VAVKEKAKRFYTKTRKIQTIQMRAKESERVIIDRAAEVLGKNRSEFIIESSLSEAKKVLLDQTTFQLTESAWHALNEILDAPTKKNRKLENLMKQAAPWEI
jgi:uncharacterized protein (DUF1778 family)